MALRDSLTCGRSHGKEHCHFTSRRILQTFRPHAAISAGITPHPDNNYPSHKAAGQVYTVSCLAGNSSLKHAYFLENKTIITTRARAGAKASKSSCLAKICATCRYGLPAKLASGSQSAALVFQCSSAGSFRSEDHNHVSKGLCKERRQRPTPAQELWHQSNMCGITQLASLLPQPLARQPCHFIPCSQSQLSQVLQQFRGGPAAHMLEHKHIQLPAVFH